MISIFRNGAKMVVFESNSGRCLADRLIRTLGAVETDLHTAFEMADRDDTIVFVTRPGKKEIHMEDIKTTLFVPVPFDDLFSSIINHKITECIDHTRISPGLLLMRTVGNTDKIIQSIAKTYNGQIMTLSECLNRGTSIQTIISFTQKPLNRKLSLKDINNEHILINMDVHKLGRKMQSQVLRFFNEGFETRNWYDIEIRIYDRYGKYMTHLERLLVILNSMDMGLVLGESWGKDHPRFLMSVLVYQVRLFTWQDPVEIKRILLGLEYIDDGTRIVDLDLFYKDSKIGWPDAIAKKSKIKTRNELGKYFRQRILNELTLDDRAYMAHLEEEVIKSRD